MVYDMRAYRMQNLYRIKSKEKKSVRLIPNKPQRDIESAIETLERTGKPVRLIILKPRQIGCTTYFCLRHLDLAYWNANQFAAVVAHKADSERTIFTECIKYPYDSLADSFRARPYNDSVYHLSWRDTGSQIKVTDDCHGITPNLLHITEVARIGGAKEMIGEALQSVPRGGVVVQESTANGIGGYFYDSWNEAVDSPNALWYPIFLKWWHVSEYELPVPDGFIMSEEEQAILEKFTSDGLRMGHLVWRREKIAEMYGERVDVATGLSGKMLFQQNYPMTPNEAFIVRSGSLFSVESLHEMLVKAREPIYTQQKERGFLKCYEPKDKAKQYLISVDPSYGESADYSCAIVLEKQTRKFVAILHGKYLPQQLAIHLKKLGVYYNDALLVIERNTGHAVMNELMNHLDYQNLYGHVEYDEHHAGYRRPGFPTTMVTRSLILSALEDTIANKSMMIPDEATIRECLNFGNVKGKFQAVAGNDDRVMALAIGNYLCIQSNASIMPINITTKPTGT